LQRFQEARLLRTVAILLAAVVLAVLFVDRPLAAALVGIDPWITAIAERVTWFGRSTSYLVIFALAGISLALIARHVGSPRIRLTAQSWSWVAIYLFLAVALSGLSNDLVKLFVGRARPLVEARGLHPFTSNYDYQSFPSGHAAVAFGLAFAATALRPRWRWPLLAFACAVAASRVILDVHHLGDVIGSALVALLVVRGLTMRFARRRLVFRLDSDGVPRRHLAPAPRWRRITPT
jgi:membrane-associated phospholipid phosphatase